MASWSSNVPPPSGEAPYPSSLEIEALAGKGRSWGGGESAPWRPNEWGEPQRGGPQWSPSREDKSSYGVSNMASRGRPWLSPEEDKEASWVATDGGSRGPSSWESLPAEREGRIGSWEPPQKRVGSPPTGGWLRVPLSPPRQDSWEPPAKRIRSPPMGEWQRVPLSPSRRRVWTSPGSQRQPSSPSRQATHWEPTSNSSGWDSPKNVGSPWVSQSRWDGPMGSSQESLVPAKTWESCRDPETLQAASRRATDKRDPEMPRWPEVPAVCSNSTGGGREDPGWKTRQGNPVDGSYTVKAGGSKEIWSGRGVQSFQTQADHRKWDNRGPEGQQDEVWAREEGLKEPLISKQDRGCSVVFPRESIPRKGQGSFLGAKDHHERYKGPGTQAMIHKTWLPHVELVEYWMRCHHVLRKKVRDKFLSCPQVYVPGGHGKAGGGGSPCCMPVGPLSPQFRGEHQPECDAVVLLRSLETLPVDPPERNSINCQEAGSHTLMASPQESASQFQDGPALMPELNSDQQAHLQEEASLELWHRRFGHTNSNTILRLKMDKLVKGIEVDPGKGSGTVRCVTCLTEWGPKPPCPFPLITVRSSTVLMDLVHCELSGPFNVPSLMLHRYVLIFVEDFSRFCVTYLLKETGETHKCFEKYLAQLRMRENREKSKPKAFQMNSVADAISTQTLDFLEAEGITHRRGIESDPRKSRTAEEEMKSLLEMTRCMLADAMLPEPFWGHAILAATSLHNFLPFKPNIRTCFQEWYGKVPNVKHLRVFGSLVHNRQELTGNVQHVFIGYSSCSAAYQVMNLETGVILRTRNQDFNEGKGVKKRGKFLEAIERHRCDIETGRNNCVHDATT